MLPWFKKKAIDFFSIQEKERIVAAIKDAEHQTSGEIRIHIESKCLSNTPLNRAVELFSSLEMYKTNGRNGVLIYVAMKSKKLAIYGDEGIHQQIGKEFWNNQIEMMVHYFNANDFVEGIVATVGEVGNVLKEHFPYDNKNDINELPDDILFGI